MPEANQDQNDLAERARQAALAMQQSDPVGMDASQAATEKGDLPPPVTKTEDAPDTSTLGELGHVAKRALQYGYGMTPPGMVSNAADRLANDTIPNGLRSLANSSSDPQITDLANKGANAINGVDSVATGGRAPPAEGPYKAAGDAGKPTGPTKMKLTPPPAPPQDGGRDGAPMDVPPPPHMDQMDPSQVQSDRNEALDTNQQGANLDKAVNQITQPAKQELATEISDDTKAAQQHMDQSRTDIQDHIKKMQDFDTQQMAIADNWAQHPNHYWNSLDVPQKIMAGAGLFLSTLVSAASKGRIPNIGMEWFNQSVEQDNKAMLEQMRTRGAAAANQNNLAELAVRTFHDEPTALAAMNKAKADAVATQIEAMAGRYQDEKIQNAARQQAVKIRQTYSDKLMEAMKQRNEARVQGSEVQRNQLENTRNKYMLPLQVQHERNVNEAERNSGTLTDANGAPIPGLRNQAEASDYNKQKEVAMTAVRSLTGLRALAETQGPASFTNADELKGRLYASLPKDEADKIVQTLPSHLGPGDAKQWLDGVIKSYGAKLQGLSDAHTH